MRQQLHCVDEHAGIAQYVNAHACIGASCQQSNRLLRQSGIGDYILKLSISNLDQGIHRARLS